MLIKAQIPQPTQQRNYNRGRNARQRYNYNRVTRYQQTKHTRGHQHRRGLHGVKRGTFKLSYQQSQEMDQRNLKHAKENILADELQVKPSNPSTLELLVSELKPIN